MACSSDGGRKGGGELIPRPRGVGQRPAVSSTGDPASSWKVRTWRMRSGGTSRGQYHSPFLERRSQDRGTSSSRTTVPSTRPPCHLLTCRTAHQLRAGEQAQTAGSMPRLPEQNRPRRKIEVRVSTDT